MTSSPAIKRMITEMKDEKYETNHFYTIIHNPDDPLKCLATIQNVPRKGLEGVVFNLEIVCRATYPFEAPIIRFLGPLDSVPLDHIDADGYLCMDMFEWCPAWTLRGLVYTICSVLAD